MIDLSLILSDTSSIKRMAGEYISKLKTNITSVQFKLKEIDQTKNHLLKELKHNNLIE